MAFVFAEILLPSGPGEPRFQDVSTGNHNPNVCKYQVDLSVPCRFRFASSKLVFKVLKTFAGCAKL